MGKGWSDEGEEDELRVPERSLTGGQVGVRGTVIKKKAGASGQASGGRGKGKAGRDTRIKQTWKNVER